MTGTINSGISYQLRDIYTTNARAHGPIHFSKRGDFTSLELNSMKASVPSQEMAGERALLCT
jgi:hypothetical protein